MATKVFLDTNIILDILDDKRPFSSAALQLWQQVEDNELGASISESVLTTTDYILQKTVDRPKRHSILSDLLGFVEVLSCNTLICERAIKTNFPNLEDAVLYQLALENDIDYFITSDYKALKKLETSLLPVLSASEFLKTRE